MTLEERTTKESHSPMQRAATRTRREINCSSHGLAHHTSTVENRVFGYRVYDLKSEDSYV